MGNFKVILITGATSGIGRALAEAYAAPGVTLLLTGRDVVRGEAVALSCRAKGAEAYVSTVDVTDRGAFGRWVLSWDDKHTIDLVVANAGISGGMGRDAAETEDKFREIMRINVDGVFNTVEPLLARFAARGRGQVALMGSMAGFRGLPSAVAYSVSKNAVRAYAEALRPLLARDGVGVSLICPGFIRTPLTAVNRFKMPFLMEPGEAARRIVAGLGANRAVIAFPLPMRLLMLVLCALPRGVADAVLARAPRK